MKYIHHELSNLIGQFERIIVQCFFNLFLLKSSFFLTIVTIFRLCYTAIMVVIIRACWCIPFYLFCYVYTTV